LNIEEIIKKHLVNQVAGITVHYSKSDEYVISYALLKTEKNKIRIIKSGSGIFDFAMLADEIGKNTPVWINVTGRPVISRKLLQDPGENYLHSILPNAKEAEFTVSIVREDSGEVYASAIRKENLTFLSEEIHSNGLKILGYSIGPALVGVIVNSGLLDVETLKLPGYDILFEDSKLRDIIPKENKDKESYLIGKDRVASDLIFPFATALSYLISSSGYDNLVTDSPVTDADSILFSKINRNFIVAALIFLFGLLLVNFMTFNFYSKQDETLTKQLSWQDDLFAQSDSLRREISIKKNLVDQMGLAQNTTYGYFADRIAATVPKGINLISMAINPPTSKIKTDKAIQFEKLIRIKGESNGSMLLNEWIKDLGKYDWIKDIEIIGYEKTEDKGEFEINIIY
jgi:hypothetical protein